MTHIIPILNQTTIKTNTTARMAKNPLPFKISLSYPNKVMTFYYQQINNQQQLLTAIKEVLPENLTNQARHCVIKEKKLIIYTDSASWASQLRFYENMILSAINQRTKTRIETMQTKLIKTTTQNRVLSIRKPRLPSTQKIKSLQVDSMAIEDMQLRSSLQKLSNTLEKLSSASK